MKINWTQTAFGRLAEIRALIADETSLPAAELWVESVLAAGERLLISPLLGTEIVDSEVVFRELVLGDYRMLYRIDASHIHILTIRPALAPLGGDSFPNN